MKYILLLFLILLTTSCGYFETEKISTEAFYEEELKSIDWKDVDQYPAFPNCDNLTEKPAQLQCFENTISSHLRNAFSPHNALVNRDLNDTVKLDFSIDNKGKLSVRSIVVAPSIEQEFPLLGTWLKEAIDTLVPMAPAYKRGVPVTTEFMLPIVIKTKEL